jgi:hypothetical protein
MICLLSAESDRNRLHSSPPARNSGWRTRNWRSITSRVTDSYKREERAGVERIAQALSDLELNVWYDVRLTAGKQWSPEIDHHAHKCWAMVVCYTPAALTSKWVRHEVDIGIAGGKLVPLFLAPCDLPGDLKAIHTLNFQDWGGGFAHREFRALVKRLTDLSGRPELAKKAASIAAGREADLVFRTREYLIALAAEQATATYADAQAELGVDLDTLIAALDETAAINRIRREPPLCALIIAKKTGLPGRGFFQKHCFLSGDDDDLAEEVFDRLCELVFAHKWTLEAQRAHPR